MAKDELPPDPDAIQKWKDLPQSAPSRKALPPATGGTRWAWMIVGFAVLVIIMSLLARGGAF